jgi:hypothetical protein
MRKIIIQAVMVLLAAASLCFAQTTMEKSKAEKADKKMSKNTLEEKLINKEREVWEAFKRKDVAALKSLLSDDSYEVDDDGTLNTKAQQIESVADLNLTSYQIEDSRVLVINKDVAIVTYKITTEGSYKGKPFEPGASLASAVWANRGGTWQNIFYQETKIKQ